MTTGGGEARESKFSFTFCVISCLRISAIFIELTGKSVVFFSQSKKTELGLWIARFCMTGFLFILGFVAPGIPKDYGRSRHGEDDEEVCISCLDFGQVFQRICGLLLSAAQFCHT